MENTGSTQEFAVGKELKIDILRVSAGGGRGVAKEGGFVIFVPDTAPGDVVRVKITSLKKSFAEAEMVEMIQPSEHRIEPACPVFKDCGGCTLQMIKMSEQHRQKEGFLKFALGSVYRDEEINIEPIQGSAKAFRYRNRIQLHQEGKALGFYKKGSHRLVRIDDCLITDERIISKFPELKRQNRKRRVELAVTQGGMVLRSEKKLEAGQALFSQVNADLNKVLIRYVLDEAKTIPDVKIIQDLYCGSGNFTFPFAKEFEEAAIVGVELSKSSVLLAKEKNIFNNLKFIASDVAAYLKKAKKKENVADLVLVDPPRKGMAKEVVESLLAAEPKNIFYISCNLASATRDLRILSDKYKMVKAKPFDMFPQTDHLESFFRLELK